MKATRPINVRPAATALVHRKNGAWRKMAEASEEPADFDSMSKDFAASRLVLSMVGAGGAKENGGNGTYHSHNNNNGGRQASAFRGKHPAELSFGTGGLRGLVRDITDLEAYINTLGFLEHALAVGDVSPGQKVSLAGDLRPSTTGSEQNILGAVARAVADTGLHVDHLGQIPTPALTFYSLGRKRPGIMVTGSHAPFNQNGMKFYLSTGELLKDDQSAIERAVERVRKKEYSRSAQDSLFEENGRFKPGQAHPLPGGNSQACFDYLCRYLNFLPHNALDGLRVIFYQHSSVGRDLLMVLLVSLGAEVIPVGRCDGFMAVDTEIFSENTRRLLQGFVNQARQDHGHFDAIISTDGDSDRPLLAAITPEGRVKFCSGDLLGIVTASFLNADTVVVPINASDAVDRWAAAQSVNVIKTKIGSSHVIEAMQEAQVQGGKHVVGWEPNGGFLTATNIERNGRSLVALPSRDAALPLLAALCAANERRISLSDLFVELPRRYVKTGLIDNFPEETSRALIQQFMPPPPDAEDLVFTRSFVSLRHANGRIEPVGRESASACRAKSRELERFFAPQHGFDHVLRLNTMDGLRIWFANGDIAHIRPSGTASQLRIYAVADTEARAEEIVTLALREPDGILQRMKRAMKSPQINMMRRHKIKPMKAESVFS